MLRCPYRSMHAALGTSWLKNKAPVRPALAPAGFVPLGGKVGQLCLGSSGPSGLLGSDPADCFALPQWLLSLGGPEDPLQPVGVGVGGVRTHGARGSSCPSERLPGSKVPKCPHQ